MTCVLVVPSAEMIQIWFGHCSVSHLTRFAIGRSKGDAPEIDGIVMIDGATDLKVGEFVEVEVIDSTEHDLVARLA